MKAPGGLFSVLEHAILRLALIAIIVLSLGGCGKTPCGNRVIERATSTDNKRIAYVFIGNCGATTGITTNVAIGALYDRPEDAVIVFTADDDHGKAEADRNLGGAVWTQVVWTSPRTLSINYAEKAHVHQAIAKIRDATVRYRATSPYELPPVPIIDFW